MCSLSDGDTLNLPKGWEVKKLGDVCEISTGKSNANQAVSNGQYAFFDRSKKIKRSNRYLFDCDALIIPGEGATFFPKHYFGKFDLHQRAYAIFNFDKYVNINFIEYYLIFEHKYFERVAVGATVKSLRLRHFQDLQIPLPPLPEQKRIVAILDQAFTAIAKAKANTEQNLKNAREIFQSTLQNIFENKSEYWEIYNLGDYVRFIDYRGRTPVKTNSGVRLITAKNIKLGYLQTEPQEFIASADYESWMTRGIPNFGDVIFTTEAPLAHVAQVNTHEKLAFAQRVIVMQPDSMKINQAFLKYLLLSNPIRNKILAQGTGATVLGIKSKLLKKIKINFPKSIKKQKTIVKKLDGISIETKKLETIYQQKINDLDELKKSILQKAFNGEL